MAKYNIGDKVEFREGDLKQIEYEVINISENDFGIFYDVFNVFKIENIPESNLL